jgi:hypothetical protein
MMERLEWNDMSGMVECHEARTTTIWPEYIRGVVIAQERDRPEVGYTAYVEYFKYGMARQQWGGRVFADSGQAKIWCEGEMLRLVRP